MIGLRRKSPRGVLERLPWAEGQGRQAGGVGTSLTVIWRTNAGPGGLGDLSASYGNSLGERRGLDQGANDGGDYKILHLSL